MLRSAAFVLLTGAVVNVATAQAPPLPLEVEVDAHSARVLTARAGLVPPARSVSLAGIAARYRLATSLYSVGARLHRSSLANDLSYGDVGLIRSFGTYAAEAGVGWRSGYDATTGELHGASHRFVRLGAAWRASLQPTPITLESRVGVYLPLSTAILPGGRLSGWEGETSLRYALGASPLDAVLGFRIERFSVDLAVQEVSQLRLGIAWRGGER